MTGFGRAEASGGTFVIAVEVRSVNHRHLDIALRLPRALASLEPDARRLIQGRLERGRVDVTAQLAPAQGQPAQRVRVDASLAREWMANARLAARELGLGEDVTLPWVLERPGVVRVEDAEPEDAAAAWPVLADALARALDQLTAQRATEGELLASQLRALQGDLQATVELITTRAPAAAARREARLRERLRTLLSDVAIDQSRILTEVAVWADKTDVTEEVGRLRAHLDQLTLMLLKGGPVGRPLDFLLQELNREINTIASKADDLELTQAAVAAKGTLEKVREQVQNLE
ncbi:MAG: YicC family protein [Candidatus Rokubacteria bacterium]|nr:YicC family protein [Candidatus Rokubacteria bacterium]